jgi:hypothetical protein
MARRGKQVCWLLWGLSWLLATCAGPPAASPAEMEVL